MMFKIFGKHAYAVKVGSLSLLAGSLLGHLAARWAAHLFGL